MEVITFNGAKKNKKNICLMKYKLLWQYNLLSYSWYVLIDKLFRTRQSFHHSLIRLQSSGLLNMIK